MKNPFAHAYILQIIKGKICTEEKNARKVKKKTVICEKETL